MAATMACSAMRVSYSSSSAPMQPVRHGGRRHFASTPARGRPQRLTCSVEASQRGSNWYQASAASPDDLLQLLRERRQAVQAAAGELASAGWLCQFMALRGRCTVCFCVLQVWCKASA
jgi:hypothetical protein